MLSSLCSKLYKQKGLWNENSTINLHFLQNPFVIRSISKKSGRLLEVKAITVSKKPRPIAKSDSGLILFNNNGLPNNHIANIVRKYPAMLQSNADTALKPKVDFFISIGLSGPELAKIVIRDPKILRVSLRKTILPAISFLKSAVNTDSNVLAVIKRSPRLLVQNPLERLAPNIAVLEKYGVPEENISKLLVSQPKVLTRVDRFNEIFEEIKRMEIDPSKNSFIRAIRVLSSMSKASWEAKVEVYKKWGWSEDDVRSAFCKQPGCMMSSEKKIMSIMELFVNKMGYDSRILVKHPIVLMLSYKQRIFPRCSVIHVLISNGLVEKDESIPTLLLLSDTNFLEKYVTDFVGKVPELLNVYQGKRNAL